MTGTVRAGIAFLLLVGVVATGIGEERGRTSSSSAEKRSQPFSPTVTFNKDIAPIVFKHCAPCHRPGESGPFNLLSYQDVKSHVRQIAVVTRIRFMPPWLPEPGYGEFVGERDRRLSDEQIVLIRQWVEQGAVEGNPSDLPPRPHFAEGWQLGTPDLVLKMPHPYTLRAAGRDAFRNFVFPVTVTETRYVKAWEIRPGNKKVIHHCNMMIDRTGNARQLDAQDAGPGFGGMELKWESERFEPQTHLIFWKPGTVPFVEPDGMAWRVDPGTDLVLNTHMHPSGKPEMIQPEIGLYFSDQPQTKFPMLLELEHDGNLDIPPGKKNFVIRDEFELPVDVDALAIYPHAHYLGKNIEGYAILPDGRKQWLIWIKDWDPNWQAAYPLVKPVYLPKGSVLAMKYTYDNSADNPRNPNHPPRRVVGGNQTTDEMGHLWIQVLPRRSEINGEDARMVLQEALMQHDLQKYPHDYLANYNLGAVLEARGRLEEAIARYRNALRANPGDATAQNALGTALEGQGRLEEAVGYFQQALRARPDYSDARYNLGKALLVEGKADEAIPHFREVLRVKPGDGDAENSLGSALAMQGNLEEAAEHFENALRINPQNADAHYNLGVVFARKGNLIRAEEQFRRALEINPRNADVENDLGTALAMQGNLIQAITHFERAVALDPQNSQALKNLARARAQLQKGEGAKP